MLMSTSQATQTPSSSEDEKPEREKYLEAVVLGLEHQVEHLRAETREQRQTISTLRGRWYECRAALLALSEKSGHSFVEEEGFQNFDGDGISIEFSRDLLGQVPIVSWKWWVKF
jgi:hypothetical protein